MSRNSSRNGPCALRLPNAGPRLNASCMRTIFRILASGLSIGLAGFLFGFFGPILLAPHAYHTPALAVYVTGPLGFLVGIGVGILQERSRE